MRFLGRAAVVAISVLLPVAAASAREQPVETYYATLSAWDRVDGMGHRLTSVADILRQDRANYHNRHLRDPSDIGDRYFRSEAHRREIPALLAAGGMDADTTRRILEQRPRVRVDRYSDRMEVTIEFNAG